MKIFSEKINYGILAVFELAKSSYKGHIQINDIAQAHSLKKNFLEKVLINLKRAGIVESIRGAQGGYKLLKAPGDIKILDVIIALDGPVSIIDYSENPAVFQVFWKEKEVEFNELLSFTFEELLNQEKILHDKLSFQI